MLSCECFERLRVTVREFESQCVGFLIQPPRRSRLAASECLDDALSLRYRPQCLLGIGDARGSKPERCFERHRNVHYLGTVGSHVVGVTIKG